MKHVRLIWLALLLPAVVLTVEAGGRQEETSDENQSGTQIDIEESTDSAEPAESDESAGSDDGTVLESSQSGAAWILADHELNDQLEREISSIIADGYSPVGMESTEEGVSILYIRTETVLFDRWVMHEFTKLENLNDEMTAFLVEGWLPMGFSKNEDSITALFVRSPETQLTGWRIHDVPADDLNQLAQVSEQYINEGYVPYGLSIDDSEDRIYILLLETETAPGDDARRPSLLINGFAENEIADGITSDMEEDAIPWAMHRGTDASFFLYLF